MGIESVEDLSYFLNPYFILDLPSDYTAEARCISVLVHSSTPPTVLCSYRSPSIINHNRERLRLALNVALARPRLARSMPSPVRTHDAGVHVVISAHASTARSAVSCMSELQLSGFGLRV
jgi:hypothetical protein